MVKGKRHPQSLDTSDLAVAIAKRNAILAASNQQEVDRVLNRVASNVPTVGEICAAYELAGPGRDYVRKNNTNALKLIIRKASSGLDNDAVAKLPATELTRRLVQDYQDVVLEEIQALQAERKARQLPPDEERAAQMKYSANRLFSQARAVFAKEKPFRDMRLPACIQEFRKTDSFKVDIETAFTPMLQAEVDLFAAESKLVRASEPGVYLTYLMMQWLALRNEEVLFCKPAEWITRHADGTGTLRVGRYEYYTPKGVGSYRELAVPAWLLVEIDALAPAPGQIGGREWLIPGATPYSREHVTHKAVNLWMRMVYARAKASGQLPATAEVRTSYDFRKQAGSIYYAQTKDILATQRFLGHESPTTTTKWYANIIKRPAPIQALSGR